MTARDWRAGELRLLAMALVIAVAAVTSVGFFVDRLRLGLERDAAQLLGADLVLSADQPITDAVRARAQAARLATAETVTFPSMALNANDPDRNALAAVKAVSTGYPLRGTMQLAREPGGPDEPTRQIPPAGAAWVDPQLLQALGATPGSNLKLGEKIFRIDRVIAVEPDRGAGFINFAPRVMINLADLPATQLITVGSRATYRLLAAGERPAVKAFETRDRTRPAARAAARVARERASGNAADAGARAALPRARRTAGGDDRRSRRCRGSAPVLAASSGFVRDDALPRAAADRHLPAVRARVRCDRRIRLPARHRAGLCGALRAAGRARFADPNFAAVAFAVVGSAGWRRRAGAAARLRAAAAGATACGAAAARAAQGHWPAGRAQQPRLSGRLCRLHAADAVVVERPQGRQRDGRRIRRRARRVRAGRLGRAEAAGAAARTDRTPWHLVALRDRGGTASAGCDDDPAGVACSRHHGTAAADRDAHRPRQRMAQGRAAGRAEPLRHQRAARPGERNRAEAQGGRHRGRAASDDPRPPDPGERQAGRPRELQRRAGAASGRPRVQPFLREPGAGSQPHYGRQLVSATAVQSSRSRRASQRRSAYSSATNSPSTSPASR